MKIKSKMLINSTRSIVFKVDVDTLRGTVEGVPNLLELFKKHKIQATFLFSLGPDHTGWALKRIFRPGFFSKVKRTSVVANYGLKTLMYGVLLPGPHISRKSAVQMRKVAEEGHETGIHTYDHVYWQDKVALSSDKLWTELELEKAEVAYNETFGLSAQTFGAAGWQMNDFAFLWNEKYKYASDTRGESPFYPLIQNKKINCLQMPTTLPTMDELIGVDEVTEDNVSTRLLSFTQKERGCGHVFTLHAELEGMRLKDEFEKFIIGLKSQKYQFLTMHQYYSALMSKNSEIKVSEIVYRAVPGRSGLLCCQAQ
ncbi:MAG: polysaccharide deacetylase family protein [Bdellovibrionales bacterium]